MRARSRVNGSKRRSAEENCRPLPPRPLPPPSSSNARYSRVSASRVERIWSGWTLGSVCASGIVEPCGGVLPLFPGSTSITMSFKPVFGRSSRVASEWIRSAYLGSMSISTTATPSSRLTPPTLPTWIPAMSIACPWPGVTACAVVNSAFTL